MIRNIPITLTPEQFEIEVEKLIHKLGYGLSNFQVQRLETIQGSDGEYEIDITARFEALNANFLVLIECKHYRHPVKRDVVQILYDRLRAVGAQKGIIFATARFQSGAIEYAKQHGVALVHVADGRTVSLTKRDALPTELPPEIPPYVGWIVTLDEEHGEMYSSMDEDNPQALFP